MDRLKEEREEEREERGERGEGRGERGEWRWEKGGDESGEGRGMERGAISYQARV